MVTTLLIPSEPQKLNVGKRIILRQLKTVWMFPRKYVFGHKGTQGRFLGKYILLLKFAKVHIMYTGGRSLKPTGIDKDYYKGL